MKEIGLSPGKDAGRKSAQNPKRLSRFGEHDDGMMGQTESQKELGVLRESPLNPDVLQYFYVIST